MSGNLEEIYGAGGFDASAHEPSTGDGDFEVMPPHWNSFEVEDLEIRDTRAKDGKYLWLKFAVIGSRFNGRKVFQRITLTRDLEGLDPKSSERAKKAVEIGMRELASLSHACGIMAVRDTDDLMGKTFDGRVKIRPAREGFSEDNEIAAFAPVGTKVGTEVKAPAAKAPASKPAPAAKAWDQKPPRERHPVTEPAQAPQPAPTAAAAAGKPKRPWER